VFDKHCEYKTYIQLKYPEKYKESMEGAIINRMFE